MTLAGFIDFVMIVLIIVGLVFMACVGAKTYTDSHMEDDQ